MVTFHSYWIPILPNPFLSSMSIYTYHSMYILPLSRYLCNRLRVRSTLLILTILFTYLLV